MTRMRLSRTILELESYPGEYSLRALILGIKIHGLTDPAAAERVVDLFRDASPVFYRAIRQSAAIGSDGLYYQRFFDILTRCWRCIEKYPRYEWGSAYRSLHGYCKRWGYRLLLFFPKLKVNAL